MKLLPHIAGSAASGSIAAEPVQEQKAYPSGAAESPMVARRDVSLYATVWGVVLQPWHGFHAVIMELSLLVVIVKRVKAWGCQ